MNVFVLGAGFSKPCGLPLAMELLDLALEEGELPDVDPMRLKVQYQQFQSSREPIGIEEFLDLVLLDAEWYKLAQHTDTLGRYAGATAWERAEKLEGLVRRISENAISVIRRKSEEAETSSLEPMLSNVVPGDVILTLNFDCLVENSLAPRGPVNLAFERCKCDEFNLLKLHGSVDWLKVDRLKPHQHAHLSQHGATLLWEKVDENFDPEDDVAEDTDEEYQYSLIQWTEETKIRRLVGDFFPLNQRTSAMPLLGGNKTLHSIPGLGVLWEHARVHLACASSIFFVGIRLSEQDRLLRLLLAKANQARIESNRSAPRVFVVDPNAQEVATRVSAFLDSPIIVNQCHQDVQWSELVGN